VDLRRARQAMLSQEKSELSEGLLRNVGNLAHNMPLTRTSRDYELDDRRIGVLFLA
jgi:hypothetical protein